MLAFCESRAVCRTPWRSQPHTVFHTKTKTRYLPADVTVVPTRIFARQDPTGSYVRPTIEDNGDGTYTVSYTPEDVGRYSISVKFGGDQVPGAPFSVKTQPTGDASKVKIAGACSGCFHLFYLYLTIQTNRKRLFLGRRKCFRYEGRSCNGRLRILSRFRVRHKYKSVKPTGT